MKRIFLSPLIPITLLLPIALILSACDRSDNMQKPTATPQAAPLQAPGTNRSDQPSLADTLAFIASRMQPVYEVFPWEPSNVELGETRWSWDERETKNFGEPIGREDVAERYSVDPRELSIPVKAENNHVIFECYQSKCITVSGSKFSSIGGSEQTETINEQRVKNSWRFQSAEEAERVSKAMNHALSLLGAKPRAF